MSQYTAEELAAITATPATLGRHIGQKFMGRQYKAYPWVLYLEQQILSMLYRPGNEVMIVSVPPQSGKSSYCAFLLPLWYLGRNPSDQFINISYNEKQAGKWGLRVLAGMKTYGTELFGVNVNPDSDSALDWKMGNGFGGMMSAGILGGITGNPGHLILCLAGESEITTRRMGRTTLAQLYVNGCDGDDVLSYNSRTGEAEWSPITAARRTVRSDLVRVTTEAGRTITCTQDHPVWVEGHGFVEAAHLQPGWRLRVLPRMWGEDQKVEESSSLRGVLGGRPANHSRVRVHRLRYDSNADNRRLSQETPAGVIHVRAGVHGQLVSKDGLRRLPVRQADHLEGPEVLLQAMSVGERFHATPTARQGVLPVRGDVPRSQHSKKVLLTRLRRRRPLHSDAGAQQPSLQNRRLLHLCISADAEGGVGARRWVRRLSRHQQTRSSSRRSPAVEQRDHQLGNALPNTSRNPPQVGLDSVSVVEWVCGGEVPVFDITVPATRTFFANEIAVHNCDDTLKTAEEANSPIKKKRILAEWDDAVTTRFQNDTKVLVVATRWAEDDLSGELIARSQAEGYDGFKTTVINIKAIAEPDPEEMLVMSPDDLANWTDILGRKYGEGLRGQHTQRFFEIKKASTPIGRWMSLHQGTPTAAFGGMFPEDQWRYWWDGGERVSNDADLPYLVQQVRVWDIASSEGSGDWTVGTLLGKDAEGRIFILGRERFRHGPGLVDQKIKATAEADGREVTVLIEQERSGAGISVVAHYQRDMPDYRVEAAKAEGDKESRATPYSIMQNNGKVFLPRKAPWTREWVQEHSQMDGKGGRPKHDDQIDTGAHGVRWIIGTSSSTLWHQGMFDIGDDVSPEDRLELEAIRYAIGR